jgi:hypothetical protein
MQQQNVEESKSRVAEILAKRRETTSNDEVYDRWKRFIRNRT